ncbi:MAG: hypothetical protein LBI48_01915 [Burkholderiaceae bacterium]|jgi:hypothetical protein|nr:hypothetical protein [Burkholderiaceae bacterium]
MKERPIIFSAPMIRALLDGHNPWVWAITFRRVDPLAGAGQPIGGAP